MPQEIINEEPEIIEEEIKKNERENKSVRERFLERYRTTDVKFLVNRATRPVIKPHFLDRFEETKPIMQWVAVVLLPLIIMFSLIVVELMAQTFTDLALNGEDLGNQLVIVQFLLTFINLSLFAASAWFWFQWVRTGGFGILGL